MRLVERPNRRERDRLDAGSASASWTLASSSLRGGSLNDSIAPARPSLFAPGLAVRCSVRRREGLCVATFLALEDVVDRFDDVLTRLAVDDHVVDVLLRARNIDGVLVGQAIVPAAIRDAEKVRVLLISVCHLAADELPHVNITLGVLKSRQLLLRERNAVARGQKIVTATIIVF